MTNAIFTYNGAEISSLKERSGQRVYATPLAPVKDETEAVYRAVFEDGYADDVFADELEWVTS